MNSYLQRWFPNLFGFKTGGVVEVPPTPQIVKHVTVVEVKFTDLTKLPVYRVMERGQFGWNVVGYSDRVRDVHEYINSPIHRVEMVWGYRAPGAGFNNLFMLNKVEAIPRLPTLID